MILLALMCAGTVIAQSQAAAASSVEWLTDYPKALEKAKAENKTVLLNFTGSDWCGWCIRLNNEVFSKTEFADWAAKNLVCVKLDFPRRTAIDPALSAQNQKLAQTHGVTGFPTIILVDGAGKTVGRTGYKAGGPVPYVQHLEALLGK